MIPLDWLFDGLIGVTVLWLGWRAVFVRESYAAVIAFIALGMLLALSWLRLSAPDLALAEAALGGGVTGALLLSALAELERAPAKRKEDDDAG